MTKRIKVAVSPFYGGTEWTDKHTGVTFKKNVNGMNVYSIPADSDMTGIAAAIRLNALILFEGEISQDYIEASKSYQEPGRWTETVVEKTGPVVDGETGAGDDDEAGDEEEEEADPEPDPPVEPDPEPEPDPEQEPEPEPEETPGDEDEVEDPVVKDPPAVDPEPEPTEPEETLEDDEENPEASGAQTFSLDETPEYETVNPDDMTVDELKAHTEKYNIPVEGTGSNGNAIKADYIAAIKAYQE